MPHKLTNLKTPVPSDLLVAQAATPEPIVEIAAPEDKMRVLVTVDMKEGFWKELTGGDKHDYSFAASDIPALVTSVQDLLRKHGG